MEMKTIVKFNKEEIVHLRKASEIVSDMCNNFIGCDDCPINKQCNLIKNANRWTFKDVINDVVDTLVKEDS